MTRTYRILIGVVLFGAAAFGYWNYVLAPKRKDAADLQTKISVAQAQVNQTRQTLAEYQTAKAKYAANYQQIVNLGKAVPADDDTRSLVVQVDAAAKRSGIAFKDIDLVSAGSSPASNVATQSTVTDLPPGAVNAGNFSVMPFSLAFTGEYGTLGSFFSRLERFVTLKGDAIEVDGRLLKIEKIALTPADDGWPYIQAQLSANAFVVPKDSDPASGATATGPAGTAGTTGATTNSTSTTSTTSTTTTTSDLR